MNPLFSFTLKAVSGHFIKPNGMIHYLWDALLTGLPCAGHYLSLICLSLDIPTLDCLKSWWLLQHKAVMWLFYNQIGPNACLLPPSDFTSVGTCFFYWTSFKKADQILRNLVELCAIKRVAWRWCMAWCDLQAWLRTSIIAVMWRFSFSTRLCFNWLRTWFFSVHFSKLGINSTITIAAADMKKCTYKSGDGVWKLWRI